MSAVGLAHGEPHHQPGHGMMMFGLTAILLLIGMDVVQEHWLSLIPAMIVAGQGRG